MSEKHYVIIGNGPAGKEAAATLRDKAPEARITILTKENHGHYQPMRLPDYIAGRIELDKVFSTPFDFYEEKKIKLRVGQEVALLDLSKRCLVLSHKELISFTGLIIAAGGKPRVPAPYMVFEDLFLTLKTVHDAERWISRLPDVDSVLIVGGDLTSFAMASALLKLGKKVHFVFSEEAFWPMIPTNDIYTAASESLTDKGVKVIPGRLRSVVRHDENKYEVFTNFESVEVGLVGAFFGLRPDVRGFADSGLQIERGILVDEHLNTGFEGVFAAGDCAQVYHPELKAYWVSIGYDNARNLGRIAAINLCGGLETADVKPESIFYDQGVRVNTSWWMEF